MKYFKKTTFFVLIPLLTFSLIHCTTEKLFGPNTGSGSAINMCTNPVFSVPSGQYSKTLSVLVSNTTSGSVIFYTTDGSNPKVSSTAIAVIPPFSVVISQDKTIKAYSRRGSFLDSDVVTVNYSINQPPPLNKVNAPVVEILSSNGNDFTVKIYCTTSGATIKYTYNGENPHSSTSTMTVGASGTTVSLSAGTKIMAYAIKAGMEESDMTVEILNN